MNMPLVLLNRRRRGTGFNPASLFGLNEQGVWYDPSDVANLSWRRNLLTWTEQFDNTAWSTENLLTVSPNSTAAPDGTTTADTATPNTTSGIHQFLRSITVTPSTAYTSSVYVKPNGYTKIALVENNTTGAYATFDCTGSGSVLASGIGGSGTIVSVGNGWFRVSLSMTTAAAQTTYRLDIRFLPDSYSTGAPSTSWAGNGTSGVFLWGAQLELGSVATDYQRITDVNTEVIERFPTATLYQDTIGTIPVTTPGQAVALMLDKSRGLTLGTEKVVNGTFDTNLTGWTDNSNGTGTAAVVGGRAVLTRGASSGDSGIIRQSFTTVVGNSYRLNLSVFASQGKIGIGTSALNDDIVNLTVAAGASSSFLFRATTTTTHLYLIPVLNNTAPEFDNISVRELAGAHATQATAASRPIYGVVPQGGRRNLLTWSEALNEAAVWFKDNSGAPVPTVTANFGSAPDGTNTADRLQMDKTGGLYTRIAQTIAIPSSIYTGSVWMKNNAAGTANVGLRVSAEGINCAVTGTWQRFSVSVPSPETTASLQILLFDSIIGNDETADILVWGAQLEVGTTATPYQRVTTQYDVTEAGVPSCSYLFFDGGSDSMATGNIDFTATDKMTIWAGVRKNSDAAAGILAELSANTGANAGAFVSGSGTTVGDVTRRTWFIGQEAAGGEVLAGAAVYASPDTRVLTGLWDRAQTTQATEVQMRLNGTAQSLTFSVANVATGNFGNYPLYIGARAGTGAFFNGNLFGLVVRGAASTTAQITATEAWLAPKTGVVLP